MRCPDCNKFVAYDTEVEPEVEQDGEVDEDGTFTMTVRRVLTCADCGTELKETTFNLEYTLNEEEQGPCVGKPDDEVEDDPKGRTCTECGDGCRQEDASPGVYVHVDEHGEVDRDKDADHTPIPDKDDEAGDQPKEPKKHKFEVEDAPPAPTMDTKGKGRRPTNLYGVEVHVTLKCSECDETVEFDLEDKIEASAMDEMT